MTGNNGVILVIVVLLVGFSIFRRVRTLISRQKMQPAWLALRLAVFAALGSLVLILGIGDPLAVAADLAGLAAGAVVGWFGLRLTAFERLPDGLYYTPNRYIGLAVFALFLLRLVYKFAVGLGTAAAVAAQARAGAPVNVLAQFTGDPLTTAVFFVLIGYYTFTYGLLILRDRQSGGAA